MQHLEANAVEAYGLKRVLSTPDGFELAAVLQRFDSTTNGHVIGNHLAASRGSLKNGEHFSEFVITQLLDTDEDGSAGQGEDKGHFGSAMKKGQTEESESGGNGIEQQNRFALRQSRLSSL